MDSRALVRTSRRAHAVSRVLVAIAFAVLPLISQVRAATPLPLDEPNLELSDAGQINAMAWQPDGGLIVGGDFRSINGERHRNIARFLPDGTLDAAWNASIDGSVQALAVAADGTIYAGVFPTRPYATATSLLKFGADGTQDVAWAPQFNDGVRAVAIGPDGSIYAGGDFVTVSGFGRKRLVKLNPANGAVDPAWNPSASAFVLALVVDGDGSVFAGGAFTVIGASARAHLVKLAGGGVGAPDVAWNPLGVSDSVFSLQLDGSGGLYVGGYFTTLAGTARHGLGRVATGGSGVLDATWNPAPDGGVSAMALAPDGSLYAAGAFTSIGGRANAAVARLFATGTGAADPGWHGGTSSSAASIAVSATGMVHVGAEGRSNVDARMGYSRFDAAGNLLADAYDIESAGTCYAVAVMPDGRIVVAGSFQKVGQTHQRYLLRLNPDRTLDASWQPDPDFDVRRLLVAPDGSLFVIGSFTHIGATLRINAAKFGSDGSLDPAWNPRGTGINTLAWAGDGALLVGGAFTSLGGVAQPYLAKLSSSGTGAVDSAWRPVFDSAVNEIGVAADRSIFAAGPFMQVNGVARRALAKISADGTLDAGWTPAPDQGVTRLAIDVEHDAIYVAGSFTHIGGQARRYLARLETNGSGAAAPAWNPAPSSAPATLRVANDSLYAAGDFSQIDGVPRHGLARLSLDDASVDPRWDPAPSRTPYAIAVGADGVFYAAGVAGSVGGFDRDGLFALPATTLQDTTITITSIEPEPSLIGDPYTVSFAVDSAFGTPTGSVTVYDHLGGTCETQLVDGAGSCTLGAPPASGEVLLKAVYFPDDDTFDESEVDSTHEVVRADTTIVLSPGGFSVATEPVHFFANLGSSIDVDGGTVTIGDGESSCTAEVVFFTAACDVVFAHAGVHQVTATYSGDDAHEPAVSEPETQTVTSAPTGLEIVSHTPNPSIPGQPVTVTVDVTLFGGAIGPATGVISIDVMSGGPSCAIVLPETSCEIVLTERGSQTLVAFYEGNDDFVAANAFAEQSVNQLPIAIDDETSTNEDQPFTVNATDGVLGNDEDADGTTLVVADPGPRTAGGIGGDVLLLYDGSYEYTPPPDANGDATFEYTPSDGLEEAPAPARVTIHVRPVNDPPEFSLGPNPHFGPGPAGIHQTPGFATMTSSGPGESDNVLAWHVRTISDPSGVLSGDATIALDGTLATPLSGHGGTATLAVSLTDDGGTDNGGNDTSPEQTFTVTVSAGADLAVSIFDGTEFVAGGGTAIYEITVRNLGGDDVTSARATIGASANLSGLAWTCVASDGATCSASGTGIVSDTLSLPSGSSAIYELTANVAPNPELPAEITATIAALTGATDFNPANDTAHDVDATGIFADGLDPPEAPPGR